MQLQIKARNYELSPDVRTYVQTKLSRLDKQLADETQVEVELVGETKTACPAVLVHVMPVVADRHLNGPRRQVCPYARVT